MQRPTMMRWLSRTPASAALAALLALGACDKGNVVLWPWFEAAPATEPTPGAGGDIPPPPPLTPVDPLDADHPQDAGAVPNPNGNAGAPTDGTPFVDKPVNEAIPISDSNPPVNAETGQPVTLPPAPSDDSGPSGPSPSPSPSSSPSPTPSPSPSAVAASFLYFTPGVLEPGSGLGAKDSTKILVPDLLFPIKSAPAFAQSQVYRYGGGVKGGDQCDVRNFRAPWRDNYCENRSTSATTPWCSQKGVHLGQDIRVGTPEGCKAEVKAKAADRARYEVVAVEDGVITNVGSYSITLRASAGGRIYRYLHLNMKKLKVATGQTVKKGDVVGYVSNDFGGTPTTLHLHFEIKLNTAENGWAYAPPYASLLAAYQRREANPGEPVADNFVVASSPR